MPTRRQRACCIILAAMLAQGCERVPSSALMTPSPESIRLSDADGSYRLLPAQRAEIPSHFDADALERLLQRIRPDVRDEILSFFQMRPGEPSRGNLTEFHDPALQPLLEEVWAPLWENATDEEIDRNVYSLPGREVVRQRRANARRREGGQNPRG